MIPGETNICVITQPLSNAKGGDILLSRILKLINEISYQTFVITTSRDNRTESGINTHHFYMAYDNKNEPVLIRGIKFLLYQLRVSRKILELKRVTDVYLFYLGSSTLILPIVVAKITQRKIILVLTGSATLSIKNIYSKADFGFFHYILVNMARWVENSNYHIVDHIIVYSRNIVTEFHLHKYESKIVIAHKHFLDFDSFTSNTPLMDRTPLIGYVGRLSEEKGVKNFAKALPEILNDRQDLRVLIGGNGDLMGLIMVSLQEEGLTPRIDLPGWISYDDLPNYLNQLRLLILPSYTEGLPNIMLEAMACGTPVLATPVGAIPDVIIDGKTGFIMENNSPECIAANVIRALNSPDLEEIAEAGRRFVEGEFTFERVVERWKEVLEEV
jgi:glycosyltransferase involved in cell wall biosynthesis